MADLPLTPAEVRTVEAHYDLPEKVVRALVRGALVSPATSGDAISAGVFGLIAAARSWRADGGATFTTYARVLIVRAARRGQDPGYVPPLELEAEPCYDDPAEQVTDAVDAEQAAARLYDAAESPLDRFLLGRLADGATLTTIAAEAGVSERTIRRRRDDLATRADFLSGRARRRANN